MAKDKDDKKPRAKRTDIESANERFAGILRVCESNDQTGDGSLDSEKVRVIKKIAQGETLNDVALAAGWQVLGLEAWAEELEAKQGGTE